MARSTRKRTMVAVKAAALAQVLGAFAIVLGLALWSLPVALVVAGVFLVVFGAVAEADAKRKAGEHAR